MTSLKSYFSESRVKTIANAIEEAYPAFPKKLFLKNLVPSLEKLELKARVKLIADSLAKFLPEDKNKALRILSKSLKSKKFILTGFAVWPFTQFVQDYCLEIPDEALVALEEMTKVFTAEFALRPFLREHPEITWHKIRAWSLDKNPHLRRLSSEGTRPLLPWGERLSFMLDSPERSLKLLHSLRLDKEIYVRKSVANHLNDFTKKKPDLVLDLLSDWKKKDPEHAGLGWITKHALRSLLKEGDSRALALIGITAKIPMKSASFFISKKTIRVEDSLPFTVTLTSSAKGDTRVLLNYCIYYQTARGKQNRKVYRWRNLNLKPGVELILEGKHTFKKISTRKYYTGKHRIAIELNGRVIGEENFRLTT